MGGTIRRAMTEERVEQVGPAECAVRVESFAPAGERRRPALVLLHGADGLGADRGYRAAARALAAAGHPTFLPHYLDRTGEARAAFSSVGTHFPLWLAALRGVLDRAAGEDRRIGLVGVSLGAALAVALAARDARVAALVDHFGFLPPGLADGPDLRLPPTLILHGARDAIVPVANAHALAALLARRGVPHEVVVYPDQAHGFTGSARTDAALRTAAFLRRHLAAAP